MLKQDIKYDFEEASLFLALNVYWINMLQIFPLLSGECSSTSQS